MSIKHKAISYLSGLAVASGAASLFTKRHGGCGSIFMLHSIVPDDTILPLENVHTKIGFLDRVIRHFIKERIEIISLSDAMSRLERGSTERFACFTFDDGYRDNVTRALPVFKRYGIPMTIYVTSAFLERRYSDYWWGQLRHLVMDHSAIIGEAAPERLSMASASEKIRAYRKITNWVKDGTLDEDRLRILFDQHNVSSSDCLDRDALSDGELAAAALNEPLLEIGAHTDTHVRLASLDKEAAEADMKKNKMHLEKTIQREVRHFAYPYGDPSSCGEREFQLAKAVGFETAVTTRIGNLFADHALQRWALPRLRFLGACETLGFIEGQRSGMMSVLAGRARQS